MGFKTCLLFMLIIICVTRDASAVPQHCQHAVESGNCFGYFVKYAHVNGKCEDFVYGGCGGNDNRFDTKKDCEDACINVN